MRCSWICKLNITKFWNKSETKHVYNTRGKYSTLNKAMLCEVLPTYVIRVLSSASPIDFLNSDDEKLATGQVCRILRRNEPQLTKQLKLLNQVLKAMFWNVSLPHNITTGTTQWGHHSCDNDTISTGSSNLKWRLSVSEPTEAWATLQVSRIWIQQGYKMFLSTYYVAFIKHRYL